MAQSSPRSKSNREAVEAAARARAAMPVAAADLDPEQQVVILEHVAQSGNLKEAAALARTTTGTVRRRARNDPIFAEALAEAWDDFKDGVLLPAARQRAVDGIEEGVYYRGEPARDSAGVPAKVKKYSDALLLRLLEVHDPRFRPHSVQEPRQTPVGPETLDALSPAAREKLEAFLQQRIRDDAQLSPPTAPPQEN